MPEKYQLKNGMNVLLIESHKSPVVAVQAWVKTGSADEKKGLEGISHFIEHLVFKGSQKFGVGEIAQTVESAGGEINAYTTFDQTVFYVTISKEFTDVGLDVISQMMGYPTFDPQEIDNEREVVIEEIKRSIDNPRSQASQLLFSTAYKKHPYGTPVIGYDDVIRRVSAVDIKKYYESRYLPQNMNLVVVGDFKSLEMKEKVQQFFGTFKRNKLATAKRQIEPAQKTSRLNVKEAKFNENFLYISWPAMQATHRDNIALSIFATILGQGESSRLVQAIRNEKQLVNSVGSSVFTPKEPGFFAVSASLNQEKLKDTLVAIQDEISRLLIEGPTDEEIRKAIRIIESEKYYSMETVDGLAGLYGYFEFLYKDYRYFSKLLQQTEKLKKSDIMKVARKYIRPDIMNISYLTNANREAAEAILENFHSDFKKKLKYVRLPQKTTKKGKAGPGLTWKAPIKDKAENTQRIPLGGGARMVTKVMNGSPVVSLRIGFQGGLRAESEKTPGANELAQRVWPAATKKRGEAELNYEIENMASGLSAFGGRNSLGLSLTALAPNFHKTFDILTEIMLEPAFLTETFLREKEQMQEHIKSRGDKPAQKCMLNLTSDMFAGHPYARDPFGSSDTVEKLKIEDLKEHLQKLIAVDNMVVSVVGDVDKNKVQRKIEKLLKEIPKKAALPAIQPPGALTKNSHKFIELNKEQTHIALAYRGLRIYDQERFALEVMQSLLSGQGGRLFVELRDKASLAYTVSPIRMDGIDTGYFGAYIGCSPEKADRAVKMMKAEFLRLTEELVSDDELVRSKRYLVGRHDIGLQRTGHVADLTLFDELYGLPFNEFENYRDDLQKVTAKDIQSIARTIFARPSVLSVVGQRDVTV